MMRILGLDEDNSMPVLGHFRENLLNFDNVYDLLVQSVKEENFKKSKINKEVLGVIIASVVIWRVALNRKRPRYINRGKANDDLLNYLSGILKTFDLEPDIDNAYRNYMKWRKGTL